MTLYLACSGGYIKKTAVWQNCEELNTDTDTLMSTSKTEASALKKSFKK